MSRSRSTRERLVSHVQDLERLDELKQEASDALRAGFTAAKMDGFDPATLRVVLRLRKMTPEERRQQRALVAIYLAALGMLEGDPLTDEARRRLDGRDEEPGPREAPTAPDATAPAPAEPKPSPQATLPLKDPEEARAEGGAAAEAGKRIYDNPYPAGDPCRAAWDEGWCAQRKSHGMDSPTAYQRRSAKPPDKDDTSKDGSAGDERGAA